MNVLILGGAGLIGSKLSTILSDCGHSVVVLDNLVRNSAVQKDIVGEMIIGSAASLATLNRVFSTYSPDVVFNFVDDLATKEDTYTFEQEGDINVLVANNICRCINQYGVKHLFFGSSCEVYIGGTKRPINEDGKIGCVSYTGNTKIYIENIFRLFSGPRKFSFTSLRFFQVCGPRKFVNPRNDAVSLFLDSVFKKYRVGIVGGEKISIDTLSYIDASYASKIIMDAVLAGEKINTINIGSGEHIPLLTLYNMVMDKCAQGKIKPFICAPSKQSRTLVCDNSLLRSLGWEQTVSIEDEISNIVKL